MEYVRQLTGLMEATDPYDYDPADVAEVQLAAVAARFEQATERLRVLVRRADDAGVKEIRQLEDLVPLLFAHTTYKSYPDSFVREGRWDRMNRWLATLSLLPGVEDHDVTEVADVDEWLHALHRLGHFVFSSSGTSGKCSFLDQSPADRTVTRATQVLNMRWATGAVPNADRPVFLLGPSRGFHRFIDAFSAIGDAYGRAGGVHYLSDVPATVAEANAMGAMRRLVLEGTATPADVAAFQDGARRRQQEMQEALLHLVDTILEHRDEPMIVMGMWQQHFAIAEAARARGIGEGEFHPDTAVVVGGGLKGNDLPIDYRKRVTRFYGIDPSHFQQTYGMTELSTTFPACSAGRYHCPPWVVLLVLDKAGERLIQGGEGPVEGRMAFFDVMIEGRWGGLVSGDRVTVAKGPCECGRVSPAVTDVARYTDLPEGDDKLTCAGTMESYLRGVIDP